MEERFNNVLIGLLMRTEPKAFRIKVKRSITRLFDTCEN